MFLDPNPEDNNIAEHYLQTDQRIDWDAVERMCATCSSIFLLRLVSPQHFDHCDDEYRSR